MAFRTASMDKKASSMNVDIIAVDQDLFAADARRFDVEQNFINAEHGDVRAWTKNHHRRRCKG
jgi:hypothetical protein